MFRFLGGDRRRNKKRRPRVPRGRPPGPVVGPILGEGDVDHENEEFLIGEFRRGKVGFSESIGNEEVGNLDYVPLRSSNVVESGFT